MNFIQQAYKGKNGWMYYMVVILLVLFGWQFIGVLPLGVVAFFHSSNIHEFTSAAENNFMTLGINNNLFLFLMILTFAIGLIFLYLGINFIHKRSFTSLITSREKVDWHRFFTGFFTWGLIAVTVTMVGIFLMPENYTYNFKAIPFFTLVIVSLLFLPFQTSFEELLFRGYLMQGIGVATRNKYFPLIILSIFLGIGFVIYFTPIYGLSVLEGIIVFLGFTVVLGLLIRLRLLENFINSKLNGQLFCFFNSYAVPLIITSVIFGLLHGANPEVQKLGAISMVFYIGTGLFFGIVALMDEGLELSLGLHAINNIVAAFLVTTDWTVFQTDALFIDTSEPSVGFEMFFPILVLYPLVLVFFSKKYGWKNWKEKLLGRIEAPVNEIS